MKSTGIVRRIDELGRIVIPKEIRKNLKIKDGESLEVFINNDEIVLKKFSNMSEMDKLFDNYIKIINDITGNTVFITDRDKIIGSLESKKNDYLNKNIGDSINYVIESRNSVLSNDLKQLEIKENENITSNYYITPIITNSDILGAVVMLSNKNIEEKDKLTIDIVSKLIANYIE